MSVREQARSIADYSLLDNRVQSSPFEFYDLLHRECPVYRMPETGFYIVTKYEDAREVLRDTDSYSSVVLGMKELLGPGAELYQQILRERGWEHVHVLHRSDPPAHSHYRKLVDRVFTAKRVRDLTPRIDAVANELIDRFIDRGECEFVSEFSLPMPAIVLAEQLGLDKSEVGRFKTWAETMLATSNRLMSEEELRATADIELEAQHYLAALFEERRQNPTGDLISGLVHAHLKGEEPLSMHELQNIMHQLITGGFETTTSAIAHGLWLLIRHPDQMERLRNDRSLMKNFVEEVLRIESPVQGLMRRTAREVELNGVTISAESVVIVRYGAANRDPEKFVCPHLFDIARENAGAQLAFGSGPHFCVGAMLARQEMASSFSAILDRMDDIALARPLSDPPHLPSLNFMTLRELPIRFRKR